MRACTWMSLLALTACGSSWDLRKGVEGPPLECESLLNYYPDQDGDGWGDPAAAGSPVPLCAPEEEGALTATNAKDCNDLDEAIGPNTGTCPDQLGDAETIIRAGLVRGASEYLFVFSEGDPEVRGALEGYSIDAREDCKSWAGVAGEGVPEGDRGLAVLTDSVEVAEALDKLDELFLAYNIDTSPCTTGSEPECMAFFVGAGWEGTLPASCDGSFDGEWVWDDGNGPTGDIPFCRNREPSPQDFFTGTQLCALSEDDAWAKIQPLRLAMVRTEEEWCLGRAPYMPGAQLDGAIYPGNHPDKAFFACERPVYDPGDYVDVPEKDSREDG